MGQYDRLRNTATRLITKYGEKVRYIRVLDGAPIDGKSWNKAAPTKTETIVPIVFLPKNSQLEQLIQMMQNGNVQTGNEIAWVPSLSFEPSLKDIIIRSDGVERRIKAISPIQPNGETVVVYKMDIQE